MNNRYIFRGKGNPKYNTGEWYYGYLTYDGSDYQIAEPKYGCCKRTVIPETVGQCTGLKDKNGKLIFEGDVVKVRAPKYSGIYKVVWCETIATVQLTCHANRCLTVVDFGELWETGDYTCRVISNIHDNPELLEVEK